MRRGSNSGGVSERPGRGHQIQKHGVAEGPCVARRASVNLLERMDELSDGVIRPFNATSEGRRGSIS